jgi:hypothetical protein
VGSAAIVNVASDRCLEEGAIGYGLVLVSNISNGARQREHKVEVVGVAAGRVMRFRAVMGEKG